MSENVQVERNFKLNFERKLQTTKDIGGGATFFELHKIYFEFLRSDISFLEFGCNARNIIIWLALPVTVRSKAVLVSRPVQVNLSLDLMVANLCFTKRLFSNDYQPFQHRIPLFRQATVFPTKVSFRDVRYENHLSLNSDRDDLSDRQI